MSNNKSKIDKVLTVMAAGFILSKSNVGNNINEIKENKDEVKKTKECHDLALPSSEK